MTSSAPGYPTRLARVALKLLTHRVPHDVAWVGFYGYPLLFLMRLLTRKPIVFDAFLSTYDTLCLDRGRFAPGSPMGRLLFWLDRLACTLADRVVVDTPAHRDYFVELFGLPSGKFDVVPVGADEELFRAAPMPEHKGIHVYFYGSFIPLQGTDVIVQAAAMLKDRQDIRITIAGDGPGRPPVERLARELGCRNVSFPGWVPYHSLPEAIAEADICLGGHFSRIRKAGNVVSTKAYQFLAMARPTIVGDHPANRDAFVHGEHVWMSAPGDAAALADAIRTLADDPALRHRLAESGLQLFRENYTVDRVASEVERILAGCSRPGTRHPVLTANAWLRFDVIRRLLGETRDVHRVLEVGCGEGALGGWLAERYEYTGLEPDRAACEVAARRIGARGRLVRGGTSSLDPDERFDLVCAFEVLEHMQDDAATVRDWAARLRPGGRLLLSVPAFQRDFGPADRMAGHFRRYDPDAMQRLLEGCGLEQVQVYFYGVPLGYVLQWGRNLLSRLTPVSADPLENTSRSGRWMQPSGGLATVIRWGTAPFRAIQRLFERSGRGTGLVVIAKTPGGSPATDARNDGRTRTA